MATKKIVTVQNVRNLVIDIHPFVVMGQMNTREYVVHLQTVRNAIVNERKLTTGDYHSLVGRTQLREKSKAAFAAMRDWVVANTTPKMFAPAEA